MEYQSDTKRKVNCAQCGRRLKRGGLKYNIKIQVVSDFDGYLEDYRRKPLDYLEKKLQTLERDLAYRTSKELEEDVNLERVFLVCEECRDVFVRSLKRFEDFK